MIYNCIDGTTIEYKEINGVQTYTVRDKYDDIINKNLNIDIFNDKLKLGDLLDKYNIIKITLEQFEYQELKSNIHSVSKKLINLHILDCDKLILDSKLINGDNINLENLVPYVDYRYINQFKDTINELDSSISFKEIIVYLPDKYIWTDIIYDFKNLTKKLKLITTERGLYISSNIDPYTDINKINIINQLWTTFDLTLDICLNQLGDTIDSSSVPEVEQALEDINLEEGMNDYIESGEFVEDYINKLEGTTSSLEDSQDNLSASENDFYNNYGFLNKDDKILNNKDVFENINDSGNSIDNLLYKYEVDFESNPEMPLINKRPLEFLKKRDIYWFKIINTFINKTPNIYGINLMPGELDYFIPNRINNISNFNPKLSKIKIINNYTYNNGIILDIFDCSLEKYVQSSEKLNS